ncbi:hypothetical protein, partial [Pseudomonas proteolytica]|uniref:hypothetical protein n=1 Tax=Pseudomonas proteolytica TaxID=219574 RepID=UPI0019638BDC
MDRCTAAIAVCQSINLLADLPPSQHRYLHNFQKLTNSPVASGLAPRWAAKQPQNQPLRCIWYNAFRLLGLLR